MVLVQLEPLKGYFIRIMKKNNIIYLLLFLMGCSNSPQFPINSIPTKKTFVKDENITLKNYKKDIYQNDFGDEFDFFNEYGYYCNGRYYPYDDRYIYEDRLYHRGYFRPNVRHIRVYEESESGDDYYYPIYNRVPKNRVMHPEYIEERYLGSGGYRNLRYRAE